MQRFNQYTRQHQFRSKSFEGMSRRRRSRHRFGNRSTVRTTASGQYWESRESGKKYAVAAPLCCVDHIRPLFQRFNDDTTAMPRPGPQFSSATLRQGIGTSLTSASPVASQPDGMEDNDFISPIKMMAQKSPSGSTNSNVEGNRKRNKEG